MDKIKALICLGVLAIFQPAMAGPCVLTFEEKGSGAAEEDLDAREKKVLGEIAATYLAAAMMVQASTEPVSGSSEPVSAGIEAPSWPAMAPGPVKIGAPSSEQAKDGVYGNVYGSPDAVITVPDGFTKKSCDRAVRAARDGRWYCQGHPDWGPITFKWPPKTKPFDVWVQMSEPAQESPTPMTAGSPPAGPGYRRGVPPPSAVEKRPASPTDERQNVPVESPPFIGQNMIMATKAEGAGMLLWNGTDAKVAPKSELVMKECRPGRTCRMELNQGSVYQNTYHLPKEKPKPAEAGVEKTALSAGAMALVFAAAEVVTHVNKKGEATAIVLKGEVEATCKSSKEKILLNPGLMLKTDADGACEPPSKIDTGKLNRFWEKIK